MKFISTFIFICMFTINIQAQERVGVQLYDPKASVEKDLAIAMDKASENNKHIFVQVGGNWCSWCILFHKFIEEDEDLNALFDSKFELVKLNYSPENKNEIALEKMDFPQRFGFPVFVILDESCKRIHTQNSALLEAGEGYDRNKVIEFLNNWSYDAVHP